MEWAIESLTIEGYKSIREMKELRLRPLNVLIGSNGAGKSNFVSFFRLITEMLKQRLQLAVSQAGGPEAQLYLGSKFTDKLVGRIQFAEAVYAFSLVPTADNRLVFDEERFGVNGMTPFRQSGRDESGLDALIGFDPIGALSRWTVYHFHDTSERARVKRRSAINDNEKLRTDGENLAAFLYRLKQTRDVAYDKIRDAIRLMAPFFDDFRLRPIPESPDQIQLEWAQKGSDYPFLAHQLSDGMLRFMCLATALLQPDPPSTILLDEPELGLHPYALNLLASLLKQASKRTQVIACTQSALLLSQFEPEDVIVVERSGNESTFTRLESEPLQEWLREYSLGELWQKNVLGGRPTR